MVCLQAPGQDNCGLGFTTLGPSLKKIAGGRPTSHRLSFLYLILFPAYRILSESSSLSDFRHRKHQDALIPLVMIDTLNALPAGLCHSDGAAHSRIHVMAGEAAVCYFQAEPMAGRKIPGRISHKNLVLNDLARYDRFLPDLFVSPHGLGRNGIPVAGPDRPFRDIDRAAVRKDVEKPAHEIHILRRE